MNSVNVPNTQPFTDKPQSNITPPEGFSPSRKPFREIKLLADSSIPNLTAWNPDTCRMAVSSMGAGQFYSAGLLWDAIMTDGQVRAAMSTRTLAITGAKKVIKPADHPNKRLAVKVAECVEEHFDKFLGKSTVTPLFQTAIGLGASISHMYWDPETYDGKCIIPVINHWHPTNTYFQFNERRFYAVSLQGSQVVIPGNGEWILHAPTREYLSWLDGLINSLWMLYLVRNFSWRDWARYNEVHGLPIKLLKFPASGSEEDKSNWISQISSMGNESYVPLPQGVDQNNSYDMSLLEATSQSYDSFDKTLTKLDNEIAKIILGQNLTSEVNGQGSYAAAQVHDKIRHVYVADDAKNMERTFNQIMVPFAEYNFGDPKLAPSVVFDVSPPEDKKATVEIIAAAIQAVSMAQGLPVDIEQVLKDAGVPVKALPNVPFQAHQLPQAPNNSPVPQAPNQQPPQNQGPNQPKDQGTVVAGAPQEIVETAESYDDIVNLDKPLEETGEEIPEAVDNPHELKSYEFITKLMEHSGVEGKKAFAPFVTEVSKVIFQAQSYDQMKEALLSLAQNSETPEFDAQMKKFLTLATLTGGHTPFANEDAVQ